jgi:hypothetical protein
MNWRKPEFYDLLGVTVNAGSRWEREITRGPTQNSLSWRIILFLTFSLLKRKIVNPEMERVDSTDDWPAQIRNEHILGGPMRALRMILNDQGIWS